MSENYRLNFIRTLSCVSHAEIFDETDCAELVYKWKPNIYVKSTDYNIDSLNKKEKKALQDIKADIKFMKITEDISTSKNNFKNQKYYLIMNKKIALVTGGLGLIGSTLIKFLNQNYKNYEIICVDTLDNNKKFKNIVGLNIKEFLSLEDFLKKQSEIIKNVDYIYHLGACSSTTEESLNHLYYRNIRMTINLINDFIFLRKNKIGYETKIAIASSASTYGDGQNGFDDKTENIQILKPLNSYGISKQLVDLYLKNNDFLKEVLSLKFFNIFGVNEFHKGHMRSIAHWGVESIINNNSIKLFKSCNPEYEDGEQVRDFLDAEKAVAIMDYLINNTTGIYNIGCGETISWREMATTIIDSLKQKQNDISLKYIDMPSKLKNKYQYYTKAEMNKYKLPENLIPNKKDVLISLSEISNKVYDDLKII